MPKMDGSIGISLDEAQHYFDSNAKLRSALSIAPDASVDVHYLAEGEHNRNFWFMSPEDGKRYVLRINLTKQPFHEDQVSYEHMALKALSESGCTPIPYYVDSTDKAPANGALVMSYCEGTTLDFDHLQTGDMERVAKIMANIHAVEPKATHIYKPENALVELYEECSNNYAVYTNSNCQDERISAWAERFLGAVEKDLISPANDKDCTHILNAEPLASHFLIPHDEDASKMPGYFIDWERPITGEVAQDLGYFLVPTSTFWDSDTLITKSEMNDFVEMYWEAVDGRFPKGDFDRRFPAYCKVSILRAVCWCCKALTRMSPGANAHITQKARDKVNVYLSDNMLDRMYQEFFANS